MTRNKKAQILQDFNIYAILEEYEPDPDIFRNTDEMYDLKILLDERLTDTEKRLLFTYAEVGDLKNTAHIFHVSTTTMMNEIKKIRAKILDAIKENHKL